MDGTRRNQIHSGTHVMIVQKQDQQTGELTEGYVQRLLTRSSVHPRGIKVQLETGEIGRVRQIIPED